MGKTAETLAGPVVEAVHDVSSFDQLLRFIEAPDRRAWHNRAVALGAGLLQLRDAPEADAIQAIRNRLCRDKAAFEPREAEAASAATLLHGYRARPWSRLLVTIPTEALKQRHVGAASFVLRLFDEPVARQHPDFEDSWRAFLQAWNLLQFHAGGLEVISSEWLAEEAAAPSPEAVLRAEPVPVVAPEPEPAAMDELPAAYLTLADEFPEARAVLLGLHEAGLPPPQEFEGLGAPAIEVESLLAWPEDKIAIAIEIGDDDRRVWSANGWRAYLVDDVDAIVAAVRQAHAGKDS